MANDDISDLGAITAASPWIYNQVGANLTGILVVLLGLGLWRAVRGRLRQATRDPSDVERHECEEAANTGDARRHV